MTSPADFYNGYRTLKGWPRRQLEDEIEKLRAEREEWRSELETKHYIIRGLHHVLGELLEGCDYPLAKAYLRAERTYDGTSAWLSGKEV